MYTLWLLPSRTNLNLALSIYSQVKNNTRQPELSAKDKVRQCYKKAPEGKILPQGGPGGQTPPVELEPGFTNTHCLRRRSWERTFLVNAVTFNLG